MSTRRMLTRLWVTVLVLASACTSLDDPNERIRPDDAGGGSEGGVDLMDGSDGDTNPAEDGGRDAGPDGEVDPASDGAPENAPPEVTVEFPPSGVTALRSLRARGRVSDPDGDAITRVVINGIEAELDGDAWTAEVELAEGANDLTPEATDARGASGAGEAVIVQYVGEQLVWPTGCVYDAPNERMLVLDRKRFAGETSAVAMLYEIDLDAGRIVLLSGRGRGEGPELSQPAELAYDAAGQRAFVLDRDLLAVFEVDLAKGDRSILSAANDAVPAFSDPSGIAFDPEAGRVFVADGGANALFAIDAGTGARTVVSDAADGIQFQRDVKITYDAANDLVIGIWGHAIVTIDLADGTRTQLADPDDLNGYKPRTGGWSAIAPREGDRVLLRSFSEIVELDLTTSVRTLLADPAFAEPRLEDNGCGLDYDPATSTVVYLSYADHAVVRVPLAYAAGETTLSGALVGEGPLLDADALAWSGSRLFAVDPWDALVATVDVDTGDRTVISAATIGSGHQLDHPTSIAYDGINGRAIVLDGNSVLGVNLVTGDRTLISNPQQDVGTGPSIGFPRTLSPYVDTTSDRIIVVSDDRLLAVQLSTGDRTEFSGPNRGSGHLPGEFRDLVYDFAGRRYIAIGDDDQVLAIDEVTGNRTVLSGSMAGTTGPALMDPKVIARYDNHYAVLVYDGDDGEIVSIDLRTGLRRVAQVLDRVPADLIAFSARGQAVLAFDGELTTVELAGRAFETLYTPPQHAPGGFGPMPDLDSRTAYTFSADGIVATDLASGESQALPRDPHHPTDFTAMFMLDSAGGRLYSYTAEDGVFAWDVMTGAVTPVSNAGLGDGPDLQFPAGGTMDSSRTRLLLIDASLGAVVAVDLESGDRENLSGGPVGSGDPWNRPYWIRYDAEGDRALVFDTDRLVAVDLETGARTTLSGNGVGAGAEFVTPRGLALDSERRRAIVRDFGAQAFVAVDLDTGDRTVLAPDLRPPAPSDSLIFPFATQLEYDPARRTIFALDVSFVGALLEIDEFTGGWVAPLGRVY